MHILRCEKPVNRNQRDTFTGHVSQAVWAEQRDLFLYSNLVLLITFYITM